MGSFQPGSIKQTRRLVEAAGFREGGRVLDIGCGNGETMELLRREYGYYTAGCDRNGSLLKIAKERNPGSVLKRTDGVALDFPSRYFDGVIMECAFSLMDRHEELLHEIYCLLKPGGILAMSDLYVLEPEPERVKMNADAAREYLNRERESGNCVEEGQAEPSPYKLDGVFVKEALLEIVTETGFECVEWMDLTKELREYSAQVIMEYGSFEAMWKAELPDGVEVSEVCGVDYSGNTGYFMLTAVKV